MDLYFLFFQILLKLFNYWNLPANRKTRKLIKIIKNNLLKKIFAKLLIILNICLKIILYYFIKT